MRTMFGEYLFELRKAQRVGLRAFADKAGVDAGYYSRLEHGYTAPPSEGVLTKIATALGIEPGTSPEWIDLVTRADACRGTIPKDLRTEAITKLLPAFYAKLRVEAPETSEEMYQKYVDTIAEFIGDSLKKHAHVE